MLADEGPPLPHRSVREILTEWQGRSLRENGSKNPDESATEGFLEEVYRAVMFELGADGRSEPEAALGQSSHRFGRFLIERTLGIGGMGSVHLAFDPSLGRRVALKQVRPEFVGADEIRRRFELEARAISSVSHPNLCTIFEVGDHDGTPFLVMPFIEGDSLASLLDSRRADGEGRSRDREARLSIGWSVWLVETLARAIDAAHRSGVVHRDLKPGNIMIRDDDSPVIVDFGLAHFMDGSGMTRSGTRAGTRDYMSPEQVAPGGRSPDARTDVWALGVILYECVTGCRPFVGRDDREIDNAILQGNPVRPRRRTQGVSVDLETVIITALAVEPERRYPSALALAEDLRRVRDMEPILARRSSLARRTLQWCRREPMAALTIVVIASSLVGTGVLLRNARLENERFRLLQIADRLSRAESTAAALFPVSPSIEGELRQWLAEFGEPIRDVAPRIEQALTELDRQAAAKGTDSPEAFLRDALLSKRESLERLAGRGGVISNMERRLRRAQSMKSVSMDQHAAEWQASIARSRGVLDSAILGLVPLGPDPRSGLEEFVDLHTSANWLQLPRRNQETGELELGDDFGAILVLVPGRVATIGAQANSDQLPNFDPAAGPSVGLEQSRLPNLLVSKFEFTQSQWSCLEAGEPSFYAAGQIMLGREISVRHPVENVSAVTARLVLARANLRLPASAEWEYLARSGSSLPWYSGSTVETLQDHANVLDRFAVEHEPQWWTVDGHRREGFPPTDDGYNIHAPVGRFRPNAFGLHDVLGNVLELTEVTAGDPSACAIRGGAFLWDGERAKSWQSHSYQATAKDGAIGIRPVRTIGQE
ncbi:MAG: protein kinase [Planctomycetota bacterium]